MNEEERGGLSIARQWGQRASVGELGFDFNITGSLGKLLSEDCHDLLDIFSRLSGCCVEYSVVLKS